jgi:hypothetical protein
MHEWDCTGNQDKETYGGSHRLAFKAKIAYGIVVSEDVDGDEQKDAGLTTRVPWGRILCGVGGEAGGHPPQFLILLAQLLRGAVSTLKVGRNLLGDVLVSRGLQCVFGSRSLEGWLVSRKN